MNIAVLTSKGRVIVRPDTTRVKDGEDVYLPEFVNDVEWSPALYARVTKSGRSVLPKFAGRYFDSYNLGILLYPADFIDGSEEGYACASCLDHTSVLNLQFRDKKEAENSNNKFVININNNVLHIDNVNIITHIESAISEITKYCWLRVGDLVAVEIEDRKHLCDRQNAPAEIRFGIDGNEPSAVKIIL